MAALQLALKFRESYPVPVREEFDQLVASLNAQVPANIAAAMAASTDGVWVDVPQIAITFGSSAGVWTVPPGSVACDYTVVGDTCLLSFVAVGTSTDAAIGSFVSISAPPGMIIALDSYDYCHLNFGTGAMEIGLTFAARGTNLIRFGRVNYTVALPPNLTAFEIRAKCTFQIAK